MIDLIELVDTTREVDFQIKQLSEESFEKLIVRKDIGFFDILNREQLWNDVKYRNEEIIDNYNHLVVVGIGGSSLGGRALMEVLESLNGNKVSFLDNVDGLFLERFFRKIKESEKDLKKVHWVFVSKSGSTLETLAIADFVGNFLAKNDINVADHSTLISQKQSSPLYDWGKSQNIPLLEIPLDIGGRFSVFTAVGILPAAFIGRDIDAIKDGAKWSVENKELVCQLVEQTLVSWENKEWISVFWFYSSLLGEMGRWGQQLWAESLAKSQTRTGERASQVSVPLPLIGSIDQHSVLQQLSQGREKKFIYFFRLLAAENRGNLLSSGEFLTTTHLQEKPLGKLLQVFSESTRKSLKEDGVESLSLILRSDGEKEMGALLMLLMLVVGTLGESLDINAYDQPGVERGKVLAKDLIKLKK